MSLPLVRDTGQHARLAQPGRRASARGWCLFLVCVLVGLGCAPSPPRGAPPEGDGPAVEVLAHELTVELQPASHRLLAEDRLKVRTVSDGVQRIDFELNAEFTIHSIRRPDEAEPLAFFWDRSPDGSLPGGDDARARRRVTVDLGGPVPAGQRLILAWTYEGMLNDPPGPSRHLRFVGPAETAGHIGDEGVYLSAETGWYPGRAESLATYQVHVTIPRGWHVVSQGRERARRADSESVTATWATEAPARALTLVANRFVKQHRQWRGIELATYLLPDNAHLAPDYLDATERYLEVYTRLLGPYPFPQFAVVENFFPSGLGMPSFTLLGSGVIKRRYVQPYALGHEIVHSWLGNAVFNDEAQGNWVEGLTTYLANYYYEELAGSPGKAQEERRRMLVGYAVHVWPEDDYPLLAFQHKTDQRDNAIGYQKAAMIFHLLRQEVGEEAFWSGLRSFVSAQTGAFATWGDLERAFSEAAGVDLRWFFSQWVERPGAPWLALHDATARESPEGHTVTARLKQTQAGPPYRLRIPLVVLLQDGRRHGARVAVEREEEIVRVSVPGRPVSLQLDPAYEIFHRWPRRALPPMLNLFVTARERALLLPHGGTPPAREPYEALAQHVASREEGQTIHQRTSLEGATRSGSLLILGGPALQPALRWAAQGCPRDVVLEDTRFVIGAVTYEGSDMALLVSCRHPEHPEEVVTILYGITAGAVAKVTRLLFFYGWDSYLVFQDGRVIARGDFELEANPWDVTVVTK